MGYNKIQAQTKDQSPMSIGTVIYIKKVLEVVDDAIELVDDRTVELVLSGRHGCSVDDQGKALIEASKSLPLTLFVADWKQDGEVFRDYIFFGRRQVVKQIAVFSPCELMPREHMEPARELAESLLLTDGDTLGYQRDFASTVDFFDENVEGFDSFEDEHEKLAQRWFEIQRPLMGAAMGDVFYKAVPDNIVDLRIAIKNAEGS